MNYRGPTWHCDDVIAIMSLVSIEATIDYQGNYCGDNYKVAMSHRIVIAATGVTPRKTIQTVEKLLGRVEG